MLTDALILSGATLGGFYLIYNQLPLNVRLWLQRHRLFTRVACALGTYTILGGSVTALFAAAFLDLMVGTLMSILADKNASESLHRVGQYLNSFRQKVVDFLASACKSLPRVIKNEEPRPVAQA